MSVEQRIFLEPLSEKHPIGSFFCEDDEINAYLHEESLADMAKEVARTFVEIDTTKPAAHNVAGFFTLRAHALRIREDYFEDWADSIEDGTAHPEQIEVPLVELMWLARDLRWRGQGIGDTLMVDAIETVAAAANFIGFIGLHLRSTAKGVRLYQEYEFQPFKEHPTYDQLRYILPVGTIRAIAQRSQSDRLFLR